MLLAMWLPGVLVAHLFAGFWFSRIWILSKSKQRNGELIKVAGTDGSHTAQQQNTGMAVTARSTLGCNQSTTRKNVPTQGLGCKIHTGKVQRQVAVGPLRRDVETGNCFDLDSSFTRQDILKTVTLQWQGIGCAYNCQGNIKVVLQNVWGKAKPAEMQALLGPSGCGKSTMMDILALRKSLGTLSGHLLVNGQPATPDFIRQTSYVPQENTFIPTMTAAETLQFYAAMLLPGSCSKAQQQLRHESVLTAVGLSNTSNTLVSLLAGGQLMFHGPCSEMVSWFETLGYTHYKGSDADWVLDLIATGFDKPFDLYGHTIRSNAELATAAEVFARHYQQSLKQTPAVHEDAAMAGDSGVAGSHCAGNCTHSKGADSSTNVRASCSAAGGDSLQHAPHTGNVAAEHKETASVFAGPPESLVTHSTPAYPAPWARQFAALVSRELNSVTRNPFDVAGRVLTLTWIGILFGLIYFNMPYDTVDSVRTRANLLFSVALTMMLVPYVSMSLFTNDKRIYLADVSAKRYRPSAYYAAKVLVATPFNLIGVLCYSSVIYGMAELHPGIGRFAKFTAIGLLLFMVASQLLHFLTIVMPNQDSTFMANMLWTTVQLLYSSFFVQFSQVPLQWLSPLRYISAVYYALEGMAQNEFAGTTIDCSGGLGPELAAMVKEGLSTATPLQKTMVRQLSLSQPGCTFQVDAVMHYLGFYRPFSESLGLLLAYLAAMHGATFVALLVAARKERR